MKKHLVLILLFLANFISANGIALYDAPSGSCFRLLRSKVDVSVNNQIATIKTINTFINETGSDKKVQFCFPDDSSASGIDLLYKVSGFWYSAKISATEPDTTHPGGSLAANISNYLGNSPLYFNIQQTVKKDSILIVEYTHIEFLEYNNGIVNYSFPNDYRLIQSRYLLSQEFSFNLSSERNIDTLIFKNHIGDVNYNSTSGTINYFIVESHANKNYEVEYHLSKDTPEIITLSTFLPGELIPDENEQGFATILFESNLESFAEITCKKYTFIVDHSQGMEGEYIEQVKDAAKFFINNLSPADSFNIVSFSDDAQLYKPVHLIASQENIAEAIAYINTITEYGASNISSAFSKAINTYNYNNTETANIIVFLSDGDPTAGITNTSQLVNYVHNIVNASALPICIYSLGIGEYINTSVLNFISKYNNGFTINLTGTEPQPIIEDFFHKVNDILLLDPLISFNSQLLYPVWLNDIYNKKQYLLSTRYTDPTNNFFIIQGKVYGKDISKIYPITLTSSYTDSSTYNYKVWAKQKIEYLTQLYNTNPPNAEAIAQEAAIFCQVFHIISQFASFSGGSVTDVEEEPTPIIIKDFELLGNYPNPFNPSTTIRFTVTENSSDFAVLRIYNAIGQLIYTYNVSLSGNGVYEIKWDGIDNFGKKVSSGIYLYSITVGNKTLAKKMVLNK